MQNTKKKMINKWSSISQSYEMISKYVASQRNGKTGGEKYLT